MTGSGSDGADRPEFRADSGPVSELARTLRSPAHPTPPAGSLDSASAPVDVGCAPGARNRDVVRVGVAERITRRLDVLGQEVRIRLIYALARRGELSVGQLRSWLTSPSMTSPSISGTVKVVSPCAGP